jgi:transcription initiation factor TFIIIB Brf1 subunit/transcription initiation factor TFIIB
MTDLLTNIYSQISTRADDKPSEERDPFDSIVLSLNATPRTEKRENNVFDVDDLDELPTFSTRSLLAPQGGEKEKFQRRIVRRKIPICEECDKAMYKSSIAGSGTSDQAYICEECGKVEEIIGGDVELGEKGSEGVNDYNTSDSSAAPVRITGPNSYTFQKKLISSTSNYKKQQRRNTVDQMENIIYQYNGPKLPANIVKQAADFYYQVQQHCIKRGDVRKGTMAACLYRKCIKNNISRKPKEIADIFGIPQAELSNGEKILDKLFAEGLLGDVAVGDVLSRESESAGINQFYFKDQAQMSAFLSRYFECLNIPDTYLDFAQSLIRFTEKYHIAESSIMSSKCAGTIYILGSKLPELNIKRDDIERECKISKSTFSRFSQSVFAFLNSTDPALKKVRSRLRNIFKKNHIPLL